jgi:NAD(P)-dependent dehydrogenase (short-subunit alcohol dehydrogenase family)
MSLATEAMRNSRMMRVLVTGGTGILGRKLIYELVDSGYTVRILGRNSQPPAFMPPQAVFDIPERLIFLGRSVYSRQRALPMCLTLSIRLLWALSVYP